MPAKRIDHDGSIMGTAAATRKGLKTLRILRFCQQPARLYCRDQGGMVRDRLFGVSHRELADSLVESSAFAEVGRHHERVGRAGVGPREHLAAGPGISDRKSVV